MMKLTCTATKCVNNDSGLCSAKNIKVIGEYTHYGAATHCYTFREDTVKNAISNSSNINFAGQMKQVFSSDDILMNPEVACTAEECYHNHNGMCVANSIMVSGGLTDSMDGTACKTYVEK